MQTQTTHNYNPLSLDVTSSLNEAWERTSGFKLSVLIAGLLFFLILMTFGVASVLVLQLAPFISQEIIAIFAIILNLTMTVASYPLLAGMMMMGVHRATEQTVSYKMLFAYLGFTLPVLIASICIAIFTSVGFLLLVVPGIYLSIAYLFTLPLIIDKKMDFWLAMETSRKTVTPHWFKVFFTVLAMSIIYLLSMIPLGLGLIWTIPMSIAMYGILYRKLFITIAS
ncbi:MAG: hypothetical protein GQ582_13380 [Methyloprofundus sp.]|nr:hypothetical protein [Methyloprofundus sp.]